MVKLALAYARQTAASSAEPIPWPVTSPSATTTRPLGRSCQSK